MANNLNANPIEIDQDIVSFGAGQTLQHTPFGIRVWKIALYAASASVAGTVTVTSPSGDIQLLAPMVVPDASPAGTVLFYDNPTQLLMWKDFKVSGVSCHKYSSSYLV